MSNLCLVQKLSRKRQFGQMQRKEHYMHKGLMHKAMHTLITRMHANKGIKMFGERAVASLVKEFKQVVHGTMEGKPVIALIDPSKITEDMKQRALQAINLIKEKRTKEIKGRCCTDGSKQ